MRANVDTLYRMLLIGTLLGIKDGFLFLLIQHVFGCSVLEGIVWRVYCCGTWVDCKRKMAHKTLEIIFTCVSMYVFCLGACLCRFNFILNHFLNVIVFVKRRQMCNRMCQSKVWRRLEFSFVYENHSGLYIEISSSRHWLSWWSIERWEDWMCSRENNQKYGRAMGHLFGPKLYSVIW